MSGLNPYEGSQSTSVTARAAGLPSAPGAITEVSNSRSGSSFGLQWTAPSSNGGSAVTIAYTLVIVTDNQPDQVVYYGTGLSAVIT